MEHPRRKNKYRVCGRPFSSLELATKYHLQVYGDANWQASRFNNKNINNSPTMQRIINKYNKCKEK